VDFPAPPGAAVSGEHWACVVRREGEPIWVRLPGSGPGGAWTEADDGLQDRVRIEVANPPKVGRGAWPRLRAKLYDQRLRPIEEHLGRKGDLPAVKHLVILPAANIPVGALEGEKYTVSYAPSGTMFAWLQERRNQAHSRRARSGSPTLLALANPHFKKWPQLRGTETEVRAIAGLFAQPTLLIGPHATRRALDERAARDGLRAFDFLHLATHGQMDPKASMQSALILPQAGEGPDGAGRFDGKLTAEQILQTWKLDAELVTLSACDSALGRYGNGEGYLGLSHALFLAGARSQVLSLWKVDDTATALLLIRFYQNLRGARPGLARPLSRAEALAEARSWLAGLSWDEVNRLADDLPQGPRGKLAPIQRRAARESRRPYDHPYYWAAFILVGDPGDIPWDAGPAGGAAASGGRGNGLWTAVLIGTGVLLALALFGLLVFRSARGRRAAQPSGAGRQAGTVQAGGNTDPSARPVASSGFRDTEQGTFFWFGGPDRVVYVGPILRLEPRGEDRFYLVTAGQRHPIRLSTEQVAELARMLGQRRPVG
jgi:CHAT domain-containing protein